MVKKGAPLPPPHTHTHTHTHTPKKEERMSCLSLDWFCLYFIWLCLCPIPQTWLWMSYGKRRSSLWVGQLLLQKHNDFRRVIVWHASHGFAWHTLHNMLLKSIIIFMFRVAQFTQNIEFIMIVFVGAWFAQHYNIRAFVWHFLHNTWP